MRGGKRPGAGRPKGSENPATKKRREVADKALSEGITPLEVMLAAMRQALGPTGDNFMAAQPFARDAALYVHARLASIESKSEVDITQNVVSADPLSPDAWAQQYGNPAH